MDPCAADMLNSLYVFEHGCVYGNEKPCVALIHNGIFMVLQYLCTVISIYVVFPCLKLCSHRSSWEVKAQ